MVVTVPMTAPTTAISATADTTSRVRSDQRRRGAGGVGRWGWGWVRRWGQVRRWAAPTARRLRQLRQLRRQTPVYPPGLMR